MRTREKHLNLNYIIILLGAILLVQIFLVAFCNLALSERNIDCDSAKIYVHAIEMWRNRKIVIPDWSHLTTLELDCSLLFAVPLYGLTGNIYLSFGISNLIILFLFVWTIFELFPSKVEYALLCANLVCIPYGIGQLDYFNMMFFNYSPYAFKVLLPLMLIVLLINTEGSKKVDKKAFLFISVYFILLFITSFSSGIYAFVSGIFPVFVGYLAYKMYYRQKISVKAVTYCVGTLFSTVIGFFMNLVYDINAKGNSMELCSINNGELKDNISSCVLGMFELFRGVAYDNVKILSFAGIDILARMFFVLLMLICGALMLYRILKHKAAMLPAMLLCIFIWNTFILCVSKTQYGLPTFEYRYHLVGMIPLLFIAAIIMLDSFKSSNYIFTGFLVLALLFLAVTSYRQVIKSHKDVGNLQLICVYAEQVNADKVYFMNNSTNPEICRLLDTDNAVYLSVDKENGNVYLFSYYKRYTQEPVQFEDAILVVDIYTYHDYESSFQLFGHDYELVHQIGQYSLYQ